MSERSARWPPLWDRFWSRVDVEGPCWTWTGRKTSGGYGQIAVGKSNLQAHRVAYEMLIGLIPDGARTGSCLPEPSLCESRSPGARYARREHEACTVQCT